MQESVRGVSMVWVITGERAPGREVGAGPGDFAARGSKGRVRTSSGLFSEDARNRFVITKNNNQTRK